jgi:hypothetical protein
MRLEFALVAGSLASASLALEAVAEDTLPYEWTCKAQGYFGMKVSSD